MNSTKQDYETQIFRFRLQVKQRGIDAYSSLLNPNPLLLTVNLGCFKVTSLQAKMANDNNKNLVLFTSSGLTLVFTQQDL